MLHEDIQLELAREFIKVSNSFTIHENELVIYLDTLGEFKRMSFGFPREISEELLREEKGNI